jgi:hypothetical protein
MLQILQKHDVDYILVGAYALAAHGYPRSTLDIDIWVKPDKGNSVKLYKALVEFGTPLNGINEDTFKEKGIIFQIGVAPCRIDIITEISGDIKFADAKRRSIKAKFEGISPNILSVDDLIKNKYYCWGFWLSPERKKPFCHRSSPWGTNDKGLLCW